MNFQAYDLYRTSKRKKKKNNNMSDVVSCHTTCTGPVKERSEEQ